MSKLHHIMSALHHQDIIVTSFTSLSKCFIIILKVAHCRTGKPMPIGIFIVGAKNKIITSHSARTQLGLLKVLCYNRAIQCRHSHTIKISTATKTCQQQQQFTLYKTLIHQFILYKITVQKISPYETLIYPFPHQKAIPLSFPIAQPYHHQQHRRS